MTSKIFVGNLSFKTVRQDLERLFAEVGQIDDVFLPTDRETQRPRGFAFVTFASEEDAKKAIEKFNGHELDGRALRVNSAEERPPRPRAPMGGGGGGYQSRDDYGRGGGGFGGGFGGGGGSFGGRGGGGFDGGKPKGSRRNVRAKKRSL